MRACATRGTPASTRDAAIIALGYGAGLRRAEIARLNLRDVIEDDGETLTLRILGKRNKERLVYLNDGAALALRDWLAVRGDDPGPLLWTGRKGGRLIPGQRMTGQAIRDMLGRRAKQAGIENATPHDLRWSFVADLLDVGVADGHRLLAQDVRACLEGAHAGWTVTNRGVSRAPTWPTGKGPPGHASR